VPLQHTLYVFLYTVYTHNNYFPLTLASLHIINSSYGPCVCACACVCVRPCVRACVRVWPAECVQHFIALITLCTRLSSPRRQDLLRTLQKTDGLCISHRPPELRASPRTPGSNSVAFSPALTWARFVTPPTSFVLHRTSAPQNKRSAETIPASRQSMRGSMVFPREDGTSNYLVSCLVLL